MGLPGDDGMPQLHFPFPECKPAKPQYVVVLLFMALVVCCAVSSAVYAEITPRLAVNLYSNDNVTLASSGYEQSALIYEVKPGIQMKHHGPNIDALLNYDVQYLKFEGDVNDGDVNHQLALNTKSALYQDALFLDADATYTQQFIGPDSAILLDNLTFSKNVNDVSTVRISPYLVQRYGTFASVVYRAGLSRLNYIGQSNTLTSDSTTRSAEIHAKSGPEFTMLDWNLDLSSQKIEPDNQPYSSLHKYTLSGRDRISYRFYLMGTIGYEENHYEHSLLDENLSGTIWSVGAGWQPNRLTNMEATIGERYFGTTHTFSLDHKTERTEWRLRYLEDVTTTTQLETEYQTAKPGSNFLIPVFSQKVDVIVLKRWSLATVLHTGKSDVDFNFYDDQREYQADNSQDEIKGALFNWRYRIFKRTTVNLSSKVFNQTYRGTDREDNLRALGLSIERRIRRKITGQIGYDVANRDSNIPTERYLRHLASVGVKMEF